MVAYLQSQDYAAFNISDATAAQVAAASLMVDGFLARPDGLLWSPDANGNPAWMANKTATRGYSITNVAAGTNVTLAFPNVNFGEGDVGSVIILDRAGRPEACVINAASGNTITLDAVQFGHATATVEFGLTISEECRVSRHGLVQTSAAPLVGILGLYGSRRRHPHGIGGNWIDELLTIGTTPSSQPWVEFPPSQLDIDYQRGILSFLPGIIPNGFTRVRVNYIAGWSYATLPGAIKQAVANIVRSTIDTPFSANMKVLKAGDSTMERFGPSSLDSDTRALLQPYKSLRI